MGSPFPLPVLFTAWTWKDGAGIAGEVIRRAKLGGFKTVAVQLSQDTPDNPDDGGSTLDKTDVAYLRDAGLFVVGWDPVGSGLKQQLVDLAPYLDGWLPQVEGPGQRDALVAFLKAGYAPKLPRALVTTYGGLDTLADEGGLAAAWGTQPFTFVECYAGDAPRHANIEAMLWQGTQYGFPADHLVALVGTYRGEMPSDYTGLTSANYGGIYLEENTSDAQLQAFAALATAPAPQPNGGGTVTNDAADRNKQVADITGTWLKSFGPAPTSRMACEHDIAVSTDDVWYARRQDVRDALDGKVATLRAELADALARIDAAEKDLAA